MSSSKYDPAFAIRVRDLCYLGASVKQIAALLGVSVPTLANWRETYPSFDRAWAEGAEFADAAVAKALFKRAIGYTVIVNKRTKDGPVTEEKHIPGDVRAQVFWLINRRKELWANRVEHTGPDGNPLAVDGLTDLEIARRIAFTLAKAMNSRTVEGDVSDVAPLKKFPSEEIEK